MSSEERGPGKAGDDVAQPSGEPGGLDAILEQKRKLVQEIEKREGCRFIRFLGSGGMGEVWLARKAETGEQVAIKTIKSPVSERQRESLIKEVDAVSRLDHPWIVRVRSFCPNHPPYIVMDFVEGLPLHDALGDAEDVPIVAAAVFAKIADALEFAHERGVVHGDLKPENILLDETLSPRILDFGLSRLGGTGTAETNHGGTLRYLSPEHQQGGGDLGPWSDTYSLCLMFSEVLTRGDGAIPRPLNAVLRKGLRRRPSLRYRNGQALARDLRRWLKIPWLAGRNRLLVPVALVAGLLVAAYLLGHREPAPERVDRFAHEAWMSEDHSRALAALRGGLQSPNQETQLRALRAAGTYYPSQFRDDLIALLPNNQGREDERVLQWVLWALAQDEGLESLPPADREQLGQQLALWIQNTTAPYVRRMAIYVLARMRLTHPALRRLAVPTGDAETDRINRRDRIAAVFALSSSSDREDIAFVRNLATAERDLVAAYNLALRVPVHIPYLLSAWTPPPTRPVAGTRYWWWYPEGFALAQGDGQVDLKRPEIKGFVNVMNSVYELHPTNSADDRSARFHALRAVASFGTSPEWLFRQLSQERDCVLKFEVAEAIARTVSRQDGSSKTQALVKQVESVLAETILEAGNPETRGAVARFYAWIGQWQSCREHAIRAVRLGFWAGGVRGQRPFADNPELIRELRAVLLTESCEFRWPQNGNVRVRQAGLRIEERVFDLSRGSHESKVCGWEVSSTACNLDPTHAEGWLLLPMPFRSAVRFVFNVGRAVPSQAKLTIKARTYTSERVPGSGYGEVVVLVNGNETVSTLTLDAPWISKDISSQLRIGENEILIKNAMVITSTGIKEVKLECSY